jgi:predicted ATPase
MKIHPGSFDCCQQSMLRRVHIQGYKSLQSVELELQPLTLIIGPNASGKSNLFDALRLLSRIVTRHSIQEAFAEHRGDPLEAFSYSEGGLEALLQKETAQFTIEVDVELSQAVKSRTEQLIQRYISSLNETANRRHSKKYGVKESLLRYRISVSINPQTGALRVEDEQLLGLIEKHDGHLCPNEKIKPFIEKVGNRLHLWMEGQDSFVQYETGLAYAIISQPLYPLYYPHLIALREELTSWQFYYLEPHLMREVSPIKESYTLTPFGGDIAAFYWTLQRTHSGQFHNLEKTLQTFIPTIEGIQTEVTKDGLLRLKVKEDGIEHSVKVVSEGTLRLLALLAILSPQNPASVICVEEPENGVHPRRLRHMARLLQNASEKRQIIVNTHSALLLDYFDSEKVGIVQCFKKDGGTHFRMLGQIERAFQRVGVGEATEESLPSKRVMRGDWG